MNILKLLKLLVIIPFLLFVTSGCLNKDVPEVIKGTASLSINGKGQFETYDFEAISGQVKRFHATGGVKPYSFYLADHDGNKIDATELTNGEFIIPEGSSILFLHARDRDGRTDTAIVKITNVYPQKLDIAGPATIYEGECAAYTVQTKDHYGNLVPVKGKKNIRVYLSGQGSGRYFKDESCEISSNGQTLITEGNSEKVIYYRNIEKGERVKLIANATSLEYGEIDVLILSVGEPHHYRIIDPTDGEVGNPIKVRVQVEDIDGNIIPSFHETVNFHIDSASKIFAFIDEDGPGTKDNIISFTEGIGYVNINNYTNQIVYLTLSNIEGIQELDDSSSQEVLFFGGIPKFIKLIKENDLIPVPPPNIYAGENIQVKVQLLDINGMPADSTAVVNIAFNVDPSGNRAILAGERAIKAVGGIATFDVNISVAAEGYQFQFTSPEIDVNEVISPELLLMYPELADLNKEEHSDLFNIIATAPSQLVFINSPKNGVGDKILAGTQVVSLVEKNSSNNIQVEVRDQFDNIVTNAIGIVTLGFNSSSPVSSFIDDNNSAPLANGVATFDSLALKTAATDYQFVASSVVDAITLNSTATDVFDIVHNVPKKLVFVTEPPLVTGAASEMEWFEVELQDEWDNIITTGIEASQAVSLSINPAATVTNGSSSLPGSGVLRFSLTEVLEVGSYIFTASHPSGVSSVDSRSFNIVAGLPAKFKFDNHPDASIVAGTIIKENGNPIRVHVLDTTDQLIESGLGSSATVTLSAIDGDGNLFGTLSAQAINGVATFSNNFIKLVGDAYKLQATGSVTGIASMEAGLSNAFAITPAIATKLAFKIQPDEDGHDTVAGANFDPAITVEVQDEFGNRTLDDGTSITIDIEHNASVAGDAPLLGTLVVPSIVGTSTFSSAYIEKISKDLDDYTLNAKATGLTESISNGFDIIADGADHFVFSAVPLQTVSNITMDSFSVQAVDKFGNAVAQAGIVATLAYSPNGEPGTSVITNDEASTNSSGVATFSTTSINKSFSNYIFIASSSLLNTAAATQVSNEFAILGGGPAKVVIDEPLLQVGAGTAGIAINAVTVRVLDSSDDPANFTALSGQTIELQLVHTNGAAGSGTFRLTFDGTSNIATFSGFVINKADTNYKLQASYATGLFVSPETTGTFDIDPAAPHEIVFTTNPPSVPNAKSGEEFPVAVKVVDEFGNTIDSNGDNVELSLTTNPASATLSPAVPANTTTSGLATISGISLDKKGTGYQLTAEATVNTIAVSGISALFNIDHGVPHHLAIIQQPSPDGTGVNANMLQPIIIEVQDIGGNRVESDNATSITLEFVDNITGASHTNTTLTVSSGVATFTNYHVDTSGLDYTVKATAATLVETAESDAFDIEAGIPTQLVFIGTVLNQTAGVQIQGIEVEVRDGDGARVYTDNMEITLSVATGSGSVINGVFTTTAGRAIFSTNSTNIEIADTYTLSATGVEGAVTIYSSANSNSFIISPASPATLEFTTPPTDTEATLAINSFRVTSKDEFGNITTNMNSTIDIAIASNGGTPAGTLSGTKSLATGSNGYVDFSGLSIDNVGAYTLKSIINGSAPEVSVTSVSFNITTDPATHLIFTIVPTGDIVAGTNFNVYVEARNTSDQIDTTYTGLVTLSNNYGAAFFNGTSSSSFSMTAGVAQFNVNLHTANSGYIITAVSTGLTSAVVGALPDTNSSFNVIPATANKMLFSSQPTDTEAAATIASVSVTVYDTYDNIVTNSVNVTLAIDNNAGVPAGTLSGTATKTTSAGVVAFSDLSIDNSGDGYTLIATSPGVTNDKISIGFNIIEPATMIKLLAGAVDGLGHGNFGKNVAISGTTALIGASGVAYIYQFDGANWVKFQKLTTSSLRFGESVAISGTTAIIGASWDEEKGAKSGAAYIFHFDGDSWVETEKLTAIDEVAGDYFGSSVSISGTTAIVGANGNDDSGSNSGSAYIFQFDGTDWVETKKLTPIEESAEDWFGRSVAISGTTAIIGASGNDDKGNSAGAAYIFDFDGADWVETKLLASDGAGGMFAGDLFGVSVAISGTTAIVGASGNDDDGNGSGSAYIFHFDGATWVEKKLTANVGATNASFGVSVSISGTTAIVGAKGDNSYSGSAYLFQYDGSNWVETKLEASDGGSGDEFGYSVAISGTTALIGAYMDDDDGANFGSAYIANIEITQEIEEIKYTAGADGAQEDQFGNSVSISGTTMIVGSPQDDDDGDNSGSAYIYHFNGTSWIKDQKLTADDAAAGDLFGSSVSISGTTVIIGAYETDDKGTDSGSAYIFQFNGTEWIQKAKLIADDGATEDEFGKSVSISGTTAIVGASFNDDNGSKSGSAYIFHFDGTNWVQTKKLIADNANTDGEFGNSVAISGTTVIVGQRGTPKMGARKGSVYIFQFDGADWVQKQKLIYATNDSKYSGFGYALSISGTTIIIGESGEHWGLSSGHAFIYQFDGTSWVRTAELIADDTVGGDYLGFSVSISGTTAVIGAHKNDDSSGSAYVYQFDGVSWKQKIKLTADGQAISDQFGYSVAISGTNVIIGSRFDDDDGDNSGSVYIYPLE